MKFLEKHNDKFIWPKQTDIQTVNQQFIFYGPIQLKGFGPFSIEENELLRIKQRFQAIIKS